MLSCFRGCLGDDLASSRTGERIGKSSARGDFELRTKTVASSDAKGSWDIHAAPVRAAAASSISSSYTAAATAAGNSALLRLLPVLASINAGTSAGCGGWCSSLQASCEAVVRGGLQAWHASVYLFPGGADAAAGPPGTASRGSAAAGLQHSSLQQQQQQQHRCLTCQVACAGFATARMPTGVASGAPTCVSAGEDEEQEAGAMSVMDVLLAEDASQQAASERASSVAGDLPRAHTLVAFRSARRPAPYSSRGPPSAAAAAALPCDWEYLAAAHDCRHFAVVGVWACEELVGALCLATTATSRPASWTPEALHAVAALLTCHVTQAAAVLGGALPALLSARTISQVVAALGGAAAAEAERIAHLRGEVRVGFLLAQQQKQQQQQQQHQQAATASSPAAAATAAVFTYDAAAAAAMAAVSAGLSVTAAAAADAAAAASTQQQQQQPASAPGSVRRRPRPSCEVVMDNRALLQLLLASRASEGQSPQQQLQLQLVPRAPVSDEGSSSAGGSGTPRFGRLSGTHDPGAGQRRRSPLDSLLPKALSSVGPPRAAPGPHGAQPSPLERADSGLRRMLSFMSTTSREAAGACGSGAADPATAALLLPPPPPCRGHTLPLPGTLLAEALSKGAAGLCVDDCAVYVQGTKAFPRDLVLTRDAPMPLSLALATSAGASSSATAGSGSFGAYEAAAAAATAAAAAAGTRSRRNMMVAGSSPPAAAGAGDDGGYGGAAAGGVSSFVSSSAADGALPVVALYVAFAQPLPMPLLQAVVRSLRELLTAVEPLVAGAIAAGRGGLLAAEWRHLRAELQNGVRGKGSGGRGPAAGGGAFVTMPAVATYYCEREEEAAAAEAAAEQERDREAAGAADSSGEGADALLLDALMCKGALGQALATTGRRGGGTGGEDGGGGCVHAHVQIKAGSSPRKSPVSKDPAAAQAAGAAAGQKQRSMLRRLLLNGPAAGAGGGADQLAQQAPRAQSLPPLPQQAENSLRRLVAAGCGADGEEEGGSFGADGGGDGSGGGGGSRALLARTWTGIGSASMAAARSRSGVSFQLEAAESPRGASKLAPVIAVMHERLKAAQAAKMLARAGGCHVRVASRQTDLAALVLLQEVGRGGYGTVYRGKYYGSEVAVKVIQEARYNVNAAAVAAAAGASHGGGGGARGGALETSSDAAGDGGGWGAAGAPAEGGGAGGGGDGGGGGCADGSGALHKQNMHDAIELVASVSMAHPNTVQVLTFFTDCHMEDAASAGGAMPRITGTPPPPSTPPLAAAAAAASSGTSGTSSKEPGPPCLVLVMEYCDCGSLSDAIDRGLFLRQLPPAAPVATAAAAAPPGGAAAADAAADNSTPQKQKPQLGISFRAVMLTLLEVALALRHMHSLHLVHCDLKPQNVLLKSNPRDPRGFTAKLSDFGLAKTLAHDEDGALVIDEAVASGTLTHVAPEVFMGERPLCAAVDVYAFGILMVQMVAGVGLYEGLSPQQVAFGVAHEGLRPRFPRWVPAPYREMAQRCWAPSAAARPTAEQLVADLQRLGASGAAWAAAQPAPQQL
ncbi:hypothetical protein HYH02_009573 [Chlamydomonas schloesseri]|uniref:Protein kinase domain-containing protein n=1 Tax=Chlamydomonas schloesseri TaxID=2026947 RepID=A0A835TGM7_9CHLO|nr:hypothetical protein HYH02_009573 [Chlamydomonas schloesseri]|eukprot:KAG2443163.1 hypothetical protein HYH02_009573 [Chlamydomonas schloesseri]